MIIVLSRKRRGNAFRNENITLCSEGLIEMFPKVAGKTEILLELSKNRSKGAIRLTLKPLDGFVYKMYYKKGMFGKVSYISTTFTQDDIVEKFMRINKTKKVYLTCKVIK